ncbi:protein MpPPR_16 [Marchantia polymorpha subsp. ruderalis]
MQSQCFVLLEPNCIRTVERTRSTSQAGDCGVSFVSETCLSAGSTRYGSFKHSKFHLSDSWMQHPLLCSSNLTPTSQSLRWNPMGLCVGSSSLLACSSSIAFRDHSLLVLGASASLQLTLFCLRTENSYPSPAPPRRQSLRLVQQPREQSSFPPEALAKSTIITSGDEDYDSIEERLLRALKERRTEDAWQLHQVLRRGGILPSQTCCSRLIAQLSHKGTPSSLSRAQKMLVDLQSVNKVSLLDADAMGLLVMASARAGAARYALSITRVMLQMGFLPPVKVWSAVVSRLGKHPYDATLALELFDEICDLTALEVESGNESSEGNSDLDVVSSNFVNGRRIVTQDPVGIRPDTGAFNAVLNACATGALAKKAEEYVERMAEFGVRPDVLTFNILIKLFAKTGEANQLLNILEQMEEHSIEPDISTLNSLVSAYTALGHLDEAERLVHSMQQAAGQTRNSNNSGDCASQLEEHRVVGKVSPWVERITRVYEGAEEVEKTGKGSRSLQARWKNIVKPDVRTYTTLMNGYVKKGRMKDAVQLLIAMRNEEDARSHPNEVTYTTVIGACVSLGLMDEARSVLLEMAVQKVPANLVTYNTLLKGYCRAGQLSKAYELMKDMKVAGLSPDVVSYNTLINGCIRRDDNVDALEVFREMRSAGIAPSEVSYTTLMNAFARNGQPKLVAEVFEEMKQDPWMRVDVIAWNVLIDGYCRAGMMDEAKDNFTEMKEQGFHPTVATYGSLVKGYASAGQAGEALVIWKEIQERVLAKKGDEVQPLEPDGGLFDCLVDTCVRAGYFQRALEVVACMEQQGILADKVKYKRMFIELYSNLYTSQHASAKRRAKSADKRKAVDAFKFWLGLPNQYYQTDWTP